MTDGKCRDCGKITRVEYADWFHAGRPRCAGCGGTPDRIGGRNPYRKTPRKGNKSLRP